jgi:hypothetical protein
MDRGLFEAGPDGGVARASTDAELKQRLKLKLVLLERDSVRVRHRTVTFMILLLAYRLMWTRINLLT